MGQILDKQRAFLYGQLIQAAYEMFLHPQGPDPLRPEPTGIPAPYELGAWIHMSDFFLNITAPKFYGIVVHNQTDPDARIIAIRGTEHLIEWIDDAAALPVRFRHAPSAGRVAYGFERIYNSIKVIKRPLPGALPHTTAAAPEVFTGSFGDQLEQLAISRELERGLPRPSETRARPRRPTFVAGHSLGAALATLFVMENDAKRKFDVAALCTFASPHVGTLEFVHSFNRLPIDSWRIVNQHDIVPKLPPHIPVVLDYDHVNDAYSFDSSAFTKHNLICWHEMTTYLHWLNDQSPIPAKCAP